MQQSIDSDSNASVALDPTTRAAADQRRLGDVLSVDEPFKKEFDYTARELGPGRRTFRGDGLFRRQHNQRIDATFAFGAFPPSIGLRPGISSSTWDSTSKESRGTEPDVEGGRCLQWQLGALYTEEDADRTASSSACRPWTERRPRYRSAGRLDFATDYTEEALLANASNQFTDRFELGAGVRFAGNQQDSGRLSLAGSSYRSP